MSIVSSLIVMCRVSIEEHTRIDMLFVQVCFQLLIFYLRKEGFNFEHRSFAALVK